MKLTKVKVCDNSGAKYATCIGLYKNRKKAKVGDIILVTIRATYKGIKNSEVAKGKLYKAIVMRTRRHIKKGLHSYHFLENAVALINPQLAPVGNRVSGSTLRLDDIRQLNHKKIINITEKAF